MKLYFGQTTEEPAGERPWHEPDRRYTTRRTVRRFWGLEVGLCMIGVARVAHGTFSEAFQLDAAAR